MEFERLVSWKNGRNGAIAGTVGGVVFKDFKTADNLEAGIMYERISVGDDIAMVDGGLFVGRTANTESALDRASPHGIISPRSENFSI